MDKHDTIGYDLVGMVVDDLVVCGAEPLFLLDYISCGKVVPERMAEIVGGVADACAVAGCALVGGETAEHPGLMQEHEYDLAGCGIGIVESDAVLGSERVRAGDVIIGMKSKGLHSNGFALARHVLLTAARMRLDAHVEELDMTLGEALLEPTRIYAKDCLALVDEVEMHAFAHITGGGLAGNVARVIPDGLTAEIRRGEWTIPAVFHLIADRGRIDEIEMERTFNMGIGMVALVPPDDADRAMALLGHRKLPAFVIGEVVAGDGSARLTGTHPA
jgi:phosphoribosylformylglycinamidine cyclo-ligase